MDTTDVTLRHLTAAARSLSSAFDAAHDRQDAAACQAISRAAAATSAAIEVCIAPHSSGGNAITAPNHVGFEIGGEA